MVYENKETALCESSVTRRVTSDLLMACMPGRLF